MNIAERIKTFPNAELEDLIESSSPKVRFEFYAEHDGVDLAFFSVDGYRIGTLIAVNRSLPDPAATAQAMLDDTVAGVRKFVDNSGFQSIAVVEGGRTREHYIH